MELTQMRYFVLVAENGSTAKAAAEAMVSQSTISKSLLRLEQEMGMPLFDREGNHLVLNPAGKEFLQQVRPILTSVRQLPEFIKNRHRVRSQYRINVSAAQPVMAEFIHVFLRQEPNAEILLTQSDWIDDCDLSIAATPSGRQADSIRLLEEQVLLAVPRSMLHQRERDLELQGLEGLPLILPPAGTSLRTLIDRQILSMPAVMELQAVVQDPETLRRLVALGDGAAFWPEKTWPRPDPDTTALLKLSAISLSRELYAILPPQRSSAGRDPLLEAVIEFFRTLEAPPPE